MNHLGAGTLNDVQRAAVVAALDSIVTDADTSDSLTVYTATAPGSMDPATGLYANPETAESVTGWTAPLTLREVADSGGTYQSGDRRFIVMASDLTGTPSVRSRTRIRHDSTDYAAVQVERDPLDLTWHIIARRIQ